MQQLRKVIACRDSDSHWYVIPAEMKDEFYKLLDRGEEGEDEFIEKFSEYMTGGDLNLIQLYAYLED